MTDELFVVIDEDSLCIAKDGVVFDEIHTEHVKDIVDAFNRQQETIQAQDEMIRALINAQETLQEEIKKLKKGHILYYDEE